MTYNVPKCDSNGESEPKTDAICRFLITIGNRRVNGRLDCGNNCCLTFVSGFTLTVTLMVLFEGCILSSAGVYPGDACPDDPMTCFVFDNSTTVGPVSSFECTPGNITIIPLNATNAWCYGWIIRRNTVSRVINQIGICGGIFGVLGTFFAFMFEANLCVSTVIAVIASLMFLIMICVSTAAKLAFSVLAYIVCINCIIIGCTGLMFNGIELENEEAVAKLKMVPIDPMSNPPVKTTSASKSSNKITPVST